MAQPIDLTKPAQPADTKKSDADLKVAEGNTTISQETAAAKAAAAKSDVQPVDTRAGVPAPGPEKNTPDQGERLPSAGTAHGRLPDAAKVPPELTPFKIPRDADPTKEHAHAESQRDFEQPVKK